MKVSKDQKRTREENTKDKKGGERSRNMERKKYV
jgi:hypothetical protein